MIIRLARPCERDALLSFIAEMGFNPRDAATWDGLNMLAMTAWDGATLVGAIPLEPRTLQMGAGTLVSSLHETVVAVRPEFRGNGLGTRLQQAILETRPGEARLATVFREEPRSPAYRWYAGNGFVPVVHVDSWFADVPTEVATGDGFDDFHADACGERWRSIEELRSSVLGQTAGLLGRGQRPLRPWLGIHPYHARYAFHFVTARAGRDFLGYALLGIGALHSKTTRADILEFCVADPELKPAKHLLEAVMTVAARNGWQPIRLPLAAADPLAGIASEAGFVVRWGFDMLARPLETSAAHILPAIAGSDWRYAGIDYA